MSTPTYSIRKVELRHDSEGPDYFTVGEFQVTSDATGEIVARFSWSLEEAYLANASYSGPDRVVISEDGHDAVALCGSREEARVLLPHATGPIAFDGVAVDVNTDIAALVRRVAAEGGPRDAQGRHEPGGQWLYKLYERLGRSAMAGAVAREVTALLDTPDPRFREAALRFYYFLPQAPGADRVLDVAEERPEALADVRAAYLDALTQRRVHDAGNARVQRLAAREGIED